MQAYRATRVCAALEFQCLLYSLAALSASATLIQTGGSHGIMFCLLTKLIKPNPNTHYTLAWHPTQDQKSHTSYNEFYAI